MHVSSPLIDVRARMVRPLARTVAMLAIATAFVGAPVVVSAAAAVAPPISTAPDPSGDTDASIGTNPFIPEDVNIGDCVSALPRPDCGSREQGGARQYLILVGLLAGMGFIGWRIVRGVRSRDRADASSTNP